MTEALKRPVAKPAPMQARARAKRAAILEVANGFVLEGRIDEVTTTSIARQAGIPVGTVYRYFDDRIDILDQLYRTAYGEIETDMATAQQSVPADMPVSDAIRFLLNAFTLAARAHPSFRTLTRWANQHYSLWDVTPGTGSSLSALIEKTLADAGVVFEEHRREAATKTVVTVVSVLIDLSLEEEDTSKAQALIDELAILLDGYLV